MDWLFQHWQEIAAPAVVLAAVALLARGALSRRKGSCGGCGGCVVAGRRGGMRNQQG